MTPDISDFIPVSLVETDKYIEAADGNFITEKKTGEFQIKMRGDNLKPFIATLYNVLLAPDLCDRLFSIITLINSVNTCLFHNRFCMVFLSDNEQNTVTLLYSAYIKHTFLVKTKENSKPHNQIPEKKVYLESLHHILGNRSTISLLAEDTEFFWQYVELGVNPDPFCTSYQISTINKKSISKTSLKPNTYFKWVFMDIIPPISSKILTKDTTFENYLLIVDSYSKIPKIYGIKNITTEEVMDKLDIFQARFGKLDKIVWWDMEKIQTDDGTQFTSKDFQEGLSVCGKQLALAAPDRQEINGQVKLTWRTLRTIYTFYINVHY